MPFITRAVVLEYLNTLAMKLLSVAVLIAKLVIYNSPDQPQTCNSSIARYFTV